MARLSVLLPDELRRAARIKAAENGVSVGEICRQALEIWVHSATDADLRAVIGEKASERMQ